MIMEEIAPYIWIGLAFILIEIAHLIYRRKELSHARVLVLSAKRESLEMAQLPVNNPHPLIQITQDKSVIFANPAALKELETGGGVGSDHPTLKGVESYLSGQSASRDIKYGAKTYQQVISPAKAGGEDSWIIYYHDITALKNFEHELRQTSQEAEQAKILAEKANRARGDFLAHISHELRTPMNGIISLADCLHEDVSSPAHREWAGAILGSAKNLLALLNDLLDFSKIEAGKLSLESIDFDVRFLLEQTVSMHLLPAQQKGITLEYHLDANVPSCLKGDPVRIAQILNNLLGNAVKFTQEGGVDLHVSCTIQDETTYILNMMICDTGIGMSKERLNKLFQAYEQGDNSTARKFGGTGLGLSITQELVELMNGKLHVKSIPGEGTEFSITCPLEIGEKNRMEDHGGELSPQDTSSCPIKEDARILIVDDHVVNILGLRQMLKRRGYTQLDEALSGEQAITMLRNNTYDLVLLDCHMPDMDGFDLMERMCDSPSLPVPVIVAITADIRKEMIEKCKKSGMDDFLGKPIMRDELYGMLDKWLIPNTEDKGKLADFLPAKLRTERGPILFNRSRLNEFSDGDADIEAHLTHSFLDTLESDLATMDQYAQDRNHHKWTATVHKLYGACSNIGAEIMADLCDEAQIYMENGRIDLHHMEHLHHRIKAEGLFLHAFLKREIEHPHGKEEKYMSRNG